MSRGKKLERLAIALAFVDGVAWLVNALLFVLLGARGGVVLVPRVVVDALRALGWWR